MFSLRLYGTCDNIELIFCTAAKGADDLVAADLDLGGDPLVALVGFGVGGGAVALDELAPHEDVCARGAEVAGGPFLAFTGAAEELDFDGDGEVLIVGGESRGVLFSDVQSVLPAEIWNPDSRAG